MDELKDKPEEGGIQEEQQMLENKENKKKKHKSDKEEELQVKLNETNDKYLRIFAEYENYRKRTVSEKLELMKNASEDIIKSLLPIIDDFERALHHIKESNSDDSAKEGIELIYRNLKKLLEQKNVREIKTIGEEFNTDFHEALTIIPSPSEDLKGKVLEEVQKGYMLNEKVIRFAKVVVGN